MKHPVSQVTICVEGYDSVFSVTRDKKLRWSASDFDRRKEGQPNGESDNGHSLLPQAMNFDPGQRPRRQDWKGDLVENGMFYFARRGLVEAGILQGGRCTFVEVPPKLSLEIDSGLDLAVAEQTMVYENLVPYTKILQANVKHSQYDQQDTVPL